MQTSAIIVAAGRGLRAGGETPKQWRRLAGRTVLEHTLAIFEAHPRVGQIVLVVAGEDLQRVEALRLSARAVIAIGGATRSLSVLAGLGHARGAAVLIHDAARCCTPPEVIDRVLDALTETPGAAPALPVTDALWTGTGGLVSGVTDRDGLFRAQTPQGFHLEAIRAAHAGADGTATDDVAVARAAGLDVAIVAGDERNIKITQPGDFARAAEHLGGAMDIRTGNGFDVHRFGPGDHVMLCGVQVPFDRGLQGHSDADVGMHTVTDAIYGALAEGDIGTHFPPSDPRWKGAASETFLTQACALARRRGYEITHVDCTLICEAPKVGPHAGAMRTEMAQIMGLEETRVSIKATTSERLGFTGRGEGIAAMATATLVMP
ncbi:MAG: bifunctional 2-C-methyl-D-erythritol 4-phosphate cytidylyltransferase/2-C-methyl-D-erythritol 2,4-cyclodiphosphate synthase [Salibaculum sp.]|jgi:2-C-methyl-D-erythritol 4-phosphate cytidylyltransferase/2-C-methyl-D-erythritol 2,4-cyclodiphosphate synthase|uniref:bifunctional 2-C-methyl-D-erythritol 4-phosphate cytidylyltransferase/2-C-methyl-D-erythritol 2,4-cyclodiphosphate synthase n=1 Tax=Roseovarius halophilus (ex Wu et al. 2025) TaxID=3376060 RepID=UPI002870AFFD|nr:bifunctional 2-C-methyl-D-erythritol 4-phosphate cytidylyltransferase/2-C-methyl-D-erythritol 2,4-cyclodiphosphate synthase [Salibaculum sp.]MDR9427373.1 bifunctional 2-C-methyl-D-erythritol 4-phosphate cytidylyltransferase/2-C-methyl-D-erythritol 2,4-cyclodiphosphate synthase [Salibaculum sp.]MDR9482453.1 bifunctional 2-C-methyl-D-erythritol 4-phosphate cytidylyltransferase/2-C-methyl-D-erythritol 2,4-cyclodiphosphate synthase [Salibaculum sp.]